MGAWSDLIAYTALVAFAAACITAAATWLVLSTVDWIAERRSRGND